MAVILQMTFSNKFSIDRFVLIQISLKFVPKGPIINNTMLINFLNNALAFRRLQAIICTNDGLVYSCIYASLTQSDAQNLQFTHSICYWKYD